VPTLFIQHHMVSVMAVGIEIMFSSFCWNIDG